jgi:diguanylate cyclase (GGDEF)-like protein/PAS domain S-box-containing protein
MHQAQKRCDRDGANLLEKTDCEHAMLVEMGDLIEGLPVGVFKLRSCPNGDQSFAYVSPCWCEIYGLSQADVLRDVKIVWQQVHPDDMSRLSNQMQEAFHSLQSIDWEGRIIRRGGTLWLLMKAMPVAQNNGDILWSGIVQDVTELHLAEEHNRLKANAFYASHEGILITDLDARIVEVNQVFSHITGYEREEVLGQNPRMLKSGCQDHLFYAAMWHDIKQKGHWSGQVWNRRKDGEVYAESLTISSIRDNFGKITQYMGVFAVLTFLKEDDLRLQRDVYVDALTGAPNRMLLVDRLSQAIAKAKRIGSQVAVCYLDMDDFAPLNEQLGCLVGDALLIEMARRMERCLRDSDTVTRVGGDEFALLLTGLKQIGECEATLCRVLEVIQQPVSIEGKEVLLSASLGVTMYPGDSGEPETMLRHAEQAMCMAKQDGKSRYRMYNPEEDRQLKALQTSLRRLTTAYQRGEFVLYYQPKVDLKSGVVVGAEALIRWQDPVRGLLSPIEFLPLLDGTDLAIGVGDWVINTALTQIAIWKAAGLRLTISVNISADHLVRPGFAQKLQAMLARHPSVRPKDLELEILESAAISDMEYATRALETVSEMGVNFALDDFGTGYSSLSYFSKLPVDTLKIDQNFVRDMLVDPENLSIVESVIFLARSFNRPAIAEGVESMEHYAMLLHLGCPLGQGYGIARPMAAESIPAWIGEWQKGTVWLNISKITLPKEDVALIVARSSHGKWIDDVAAFLASPNGVRRSLNTRQCRFGRWFHGNGYKRYGNHAEYAVLRSMHEKVHSLVAELLEQVSRDALDDAQDRLPELYRLGEHFLERLDALIAKIQDSNSNKSEAVDLPAFVPSADPPLADISRNGW